MASGAKVVTAFVLGGAIALYILYSLLPSVISLYDGINFTNAPTGAEAIVGATLIVFVALVLFLMYEEFS